MEPGLEPRTYSTGPAAIGVFLAIHLAFSDGSQSTLSTAPLAGRLLHVPISSEKAGQELSRAGSALGLAPLTALGVATRYIC